jgi:hypothetical protein
VNTTTPAKKNLFQRLRMSTVAGGHVHQFSQPTMLVAPGTPAAPAQMDVTHLVISLSG